MTLKVKNKLGPSSPRGERKRRFAEEGPARDQSDCHFRKAGTEYGRKTWYKVVELYCEVTIGYHPRPGLRPRRAGAAGRVPDAAPDAQDPLRALHRAHVHLRLRGAAEAGAGRGPGVSGPISTGFL